MNKYTNEVCVLSIRAEFAMLCNDARINITTNSASQLTKERSSPERSERTGRYSYERNH